jgi:hypothetical protein
MEITEIERERFKNLKYCSASGEFAISNPSAAPASNKIPEELSRSRKSRNGANLFFDKRYSSGKAFR